MKENLYTIFRSLFIVALLCGSMNAWADDEGAPTFITDLRSEYFCITGNGVDLIVEVDNATTFKWYENTSGTIDVDNDTEITDGEGQYFTYYPTADTYVYCVATNDEGSTTSTVAKVNVLDDPTWDDLLTKPDGEEYYEIANINNWYAFLLGCDNDLDGAHFKLTADITVTSEPSSPISSNYTFDSSDYKIQYTTSCPSGGHTALFFDDTDDTDEDGANVTYTYTISDETEWGNFTNGFIPTESDPDKSIPTNVKFQLTADIELTSTTPSLLTGVTSSNFNCGEHTITFTGLTHLPADSKSSAECYQVFDDETLQGSVHYNYNVGGNGNVSGDDFVTFASTCLGNKDSFKLTGDAFVNTAPTTSLSSITSTNFDNSENNHVYICKSSSYPNISLYDNYIDLPGSPCQLFDNEDLDKSVSKYYYLLDSDDDLKTFVTTKFLQKENVTICIKCGDSDGDTEYDVSSASFTYPLEEECTVSTINESNGTFKVKIILPTADNPNEEGFKGDNLFTNNNGSFTYSYKQVGENVDALANALLDSFYQGVLTDESKRGTKFSELVSEITDLAGHGTEEKPYLIATYGMLETLVKYVNTNSLETSGMYIKLISDINAQGGERLTGVNGEELIDSPVDNVQFSVPFKGHFDGNKFSLGGFSQPLFSSLDGAEITNLGIVDCFMTTPALASGNVTSSTIEKCYASGVSNGLVPSDVSYTDCYAWNTKEKTITPSGFTTGAKDASGTHDILSDNCYTLGSKKSDCTLFIPTDNTFYTYTNSNLDFAALTTLYYSTGSGGHASDEFINWSEMDLTDYCVNNPTKSNVSLLYNVIQSDGCKIFGGQQDGYYFGTYALSNLYYWYLVDKQNLTIPTDALRIKNIYYSRGSGAYDGLNTVYLPFAWDYSTDVVDNNGSAISGTSVYILADKINSDGNFDNTASYVDYTNKSSLRFFTPSAENFYEVSCALPTILNVPQSGWAIKKHADNKSGWFYYSTSFTGSALSGENLVCRYEGTSTENAWYAHDGRSFMDIDRLKITTTSDGEYVDLSISGRAIHCGTFKILDKGTFTDEGKINDNIQGKTLSAYKLNSAGTGFVSVLSTSTVQPFRTFVAIAPSTSGDSAKESFGFGIIDVDNGGNVDSIDGMPAENIELLTPEQSRVYSIDGRYVGQYGKKLAPGLYIMNGKKILIRNAN